MKKSWLQIWPITFLLVFLAVSACGIGAGESPTPTPFPATSTPAPTPAGQPLPVALSDLAANPEAFAGVYIQLTGQYQRLPRLICRADPHLPPATWGVAGDNYLAPASDLGAQLRSLLPENLTITVAGTWRQWRGPVGCGKRATVTQLWYLEGSQILSPSPIARVTLTPTFVGSDSDEVPTAESLGTPSPTLTTPEEPEPTNPPLFPTSTLPGDAEETAPPATIAPATPTPGTTQEPPTPITTAGATATATAPEGAEATATLAATAATPAGNGYTDVEVDQIEPGLLGFEQLEANERHNWPFLLDTSLTITVSVAAEPAADVVLAILDGSETPIVEQNQAPAGQLETIAGRTLDTDQEYFIQVYTTGGAPTSYVMTVWGDDSIALKARGILSPGSNTPDSIGENDVNYWFFAGTEGDTVTITVTPNGDRVMAFLLYWPDSTEIDEVYQDGEAGAPVTLTTQLPQTGMYTIQVEEWNFEAATYQILLTVN